LPGITRDLVVELAHAAHIPCLEQSVSGTELRNADEVWLTSSTKEILPVTCLDSTVVADGTPGKIWQRMYKLYQQYKQGLCGH